MSQLPPLNAQLQQQLLAAVDSAAKVSIDSRSVQEGELYWAIRGERLDGNTFIPQALAAGAIAAVADNPDFAQDPRVLLVPDALIALQSTAQALRQRWGGHILGLTGSNGKTTCKELLRAMLAERFQTLITPGNRNNHIGLPLTLLELKPWHKLAVLEMGDNHPGEIALLAEIARPNMGYITNLGEDHVGLYGSMQANVAGKLELFDFLKASAGDIVLNADDPWLAAAAAAYPSRREIHPSEGLRVVQANMEATVADFWLDGHYHRVHIPLPGLHNAHLAFAAAWLAHKLGASVPEILIALERFQAPGNRSQVIRLGARWLVLDAYNANPSSMEVALKHLAANGSPARLAVLGEMLELGSFAAEAHLRIAQLALDLGIERVLLVGPLFADAVLRLKAEPRYTQRLLHAADTAATVPVLEQLLQGPTVFYTVLLKGSRGSALEKLVPLVTPL